MRFVLDTSVYIAAFRSRSVMDELRAFLSRAGMRARLSSVVAMELRAGASDEQRGAAVDALVRPYAREGLLVAPSAEAWVEAGRVLAALGFTRRGSPRTVPPSLRMDALLAAGCREADATLVTRNVRDFAAIQAHLRGFRFVEPWPLATRVSAGSGRG